MRFCHLDLTIVHFSTLHTRLFIYSISVGQLLFVLPKFYSVNPEDRPKIAAPVVAITIGNIFTADSLVNNPIRIESNIRQVCH